MERNIINKNKKSQHYIISYITVHNNQEPLEGDNQHKEYDEYLLP